MKSFNRFITEQIQKSPHEKWKVGYIYDGERTITGVLVVPGTRSIIRATATCSPKDTFDYDKGVDIVQLRIISKYIANHRKPKFKIGAEVETSSASKVKRTVLGYCFKDVGDGILYVTTTGECSTDCSRIMEAFLSDRCTYIVDESTMTPWRETKDYFDAEKKSENESCIKAGDTVKLVSNPENIVGIHIGNTGTVVRVDDDELPYEVRFQCGDAYWLPKGSIVKFVGRTDASTDSDFDIVCISAASKSFTVGKIYHVHNNKIFTDRGVEWRASEYRDKTIAGINRSWDSQFAMLKK